MACQALDASAKDTYPLYYGANKSLCAASWPSLSLIVDIGCGWPRYRLAEPSNQCNSCGSHNYTAELKLQRCYCSAMRLYL